MKITISRFYVYFVIAFNLIVYSQSNISYVWQLVDIFVTTVLVIGLWVYVHQSMVFNRLFWKIYVPLSLLWDVYISVIRYPERIQSENYWETEALWLFLFMIPMYYLGFRFAYKKRELPNTGAPQEES